MTEITIQPHTFDLPLGACPQIVQAASGSNHRGVERYRLERYGGIWCLNLFMGTGELRIDGRPFEIRDGFAGITRPGMDLEYRYVGRAQLTWVHFLPQPAAAATPIPIMQDLGPRFDAVLATVRDVVRYQPHCPQRAGAIFWSLLWQLTDLSAASEPADRHPLVRRAIEYIELHLAQPLRCSDLAAAMGISQNHLLRLFRATLGQSVMAYVRQRRILRARHLLQHSTLPIKTIAAEVGVPDLVVFNHLLRRELQRSPRQLRAEARMG